MSEPKKRPQQEDLSPDDFNKLFERVLDESLCNEFLAITVREEEKMTISAFQSSDRFFVPMSDWLFIDKRNDPTKPLPPKVWAIKKKLERCNKKKIRERIAELQLSIYNVTDWPFQKICDFLNEREESNYFVECWHQEDSIHNEQIFFRTIKTDNPLLLPRKHQNFIKDGRFIRRTHVNDRSSIQEKLSFYHNWSNMQVDRINDACSLLENVTQK